MTFISLFRGIASIGFVGALISFTQSFGLALVMDSNDFGSYAYYQSILMLLLNFIPFGSGLAVALYVHRLSDEKYGALYSVSLFYVLPLNTLFCFIFFLILAPHFLSFEELAIYIILVFIAYFTSVILMFTIYLRTVQRLYEYGKVFISLILINLFSTYLGYFSTGSMIGTYAFVCVFLSFFYLYIVFSSKKLIFLNIKIFRLKNKIRRALKYGFPVMIGTLSMSLLTQGDRVLAANFYSEEVLNSYAIAALIASTFLFFVNNFASTWTGYIAKEMSVKSLNDIYAHSKFNTRYLLLILPLVLLSYIVQYSIYIIFYYEKAPGIEFTIAILTISYGLYLATKYYIAYLNYLGKNKYVVYAAFSGLISGLIFFLILGNLVDYYVLPFSVLFGFFVQLFLTFYSLKLFIKKSLILEI